MGCGKTTELLQVVYNYEKNGYNVVLLKPKVDKKGDEIKELVTICSCSKKAKFNVRIVNGSYVCDGEEISIDGIDSSYEAMCPKCYIDKVLKIKKNK